MGSMAGLLIPEQKFDISPDREKFNWKFLLAIDSFYLDFLKDAKYMRSNDLLYAYCTEYDLTDIVGQMHPNSATFSAFKLRMSEYLLKFYKACIERRLNEMFGFYKGAFDAIMASKQCCFYGNKLLENSLAALCKATDIDDIFHKVDDIYLTLMNYDKLQTTQTTEMLNNTVVEDFLKKLDLILLRKNASLDDDQFRRKLCRTVEIANLFLGFTKRYLDAERERDLRRWRFDNRALVSYDSMWKYMTNIADVGPIVQKGLPYRHVDCDAAVCIFPETTEYKLLQEEFTKQNRPSNPNSEHLINDWLMHWFFVEKLIKSKAVDDKIEAEHPEYSL